MREEDMSDLEFAYMVRGEVMGIGGFYPKFDAYNYVTRRFAERNAGKAAAAKRMARERVCPLPWVRRDV